MKTFEFVALDAGGAEIRATASSRSEIDLDRELESQNLTLLRAKSVTASRSSAQRTLQQDELIALTTQLAAVTGAGVPLVEGLEGITIGRLAGELSMSKSGLIGRFGDKEAMQRAVLAAAVERFRAAARAVSQRSSITAPATMSSG